MKHDQNKTSVQQLTVDANHAGQRIDNFLITKLKGAPKSLIYRIVRKGEVRVNKKRIKPDYRLQESDVIRVPPVRLAEPSTPTKPSRNVKNLLQDRILFEDDDIVIINKPAGMAVHGGSGISLGVIEALRAMRPQAKFLELVHRLDRDTSGCLVLAKKSSALKELHELMRSGKVEKIYQTLVRGQWPKQIKLVDAPLKKNELKSGERIVNVSSDGKPAATEFRIIQQFPKATLVEAKLLTGRTHQIRVHALHVGHPIVGDEKYGDKDFNKIMRQQGCKRLFLHAAKISFNLSGKKKITISAELDKDLKVFLENLA